jgi:hypothetical protein
MSEAIGAARAGAGKARVRSQGVLVAAYREGLALGAVAVIRDAAGVRIVAGEDSNGGTLAGPDGVPVRWWCRRAGDAERIAAAATARLRRLETSGEGGAASDAMLPFAAEAITRVAKSLLVALHSEAEINDEATRIMARVDTEIAELQRSGGLKSVNASYRAYRIEATERGESVLRYQDWMLKYRANLVRKLATTLKYL